MSDASELPRKNNQRVAARGRIMDYRRGAPTWIKALTEIITNSHQSFHTMMDEGHEFKEKPKIVIVANIQSETFTIIDHAAGIFGTWEDAEEILFKYSNFHKKTHTAEGRSSFGRGMSDVLYRDYQNECQIRSKQKNGASFAIKTYWEHPETNDAEPTYEEIIDKNDQLMQLISEHGTVIQFPWRSEHERNNPFPNETELEKILSKYFELKNVLNDEKIDVDLIFQKADGTDYRTTLKFFDYKKEELASQLENVKLNIDFRKCKKCTNVNTGRSLYTLKKHCPKCKQQTIEEPLKIISAKASKAIGTSLDLYGDERTAGIFIEGEFKQIYDLTFFGLDSQFKTAAEKIGGIVVLSSSVKAYMDYMQNSARPEAILTKTRDGFDKSTTFYSKLKKEIIPWLKNILDQESYKSSAADSNAWDEGIDLLNDIAKDYLDVIDGDSSNDPPPRNDVELIEFTNPDPKIIQNKKTKLTLRINTKRIAPGEKIIFYLSGSDKRFYKSSPLTNTVPKPMKISKKDPETGKLTTIETHEAEVKVIVECSEIDAEAQLYAKTSKRNKSEALCFAALNCVDQPPLSPPTGDLQFSNGDRPIKAQAFERKRATLFVHPNIHPGAKLQIKLKCLSHTNVDLPIRFENDTSLEKNKEHTFYHVMEDTKLNKYDYRTVKFPFTCTEEGFTFRLEVSVFNDNSFQPAYAEIIFEKNDKGNNILKGWTVVPKEQSDTHADHAFETGDGLVKFYANDPTVSKYLGKNYEEAKQRVNKNQASAMFLGKGVVDSFFDELVLIKASTPPGFDYGGNEDAAQVSRIHLREKKELSFTNADKVIQSFAQNIETSITGGESREIKIGDDGHLFKFWNYLKENDIIPPPKVSKLNETRGKTANQTIFHFETKQQKFDISVYEFDNSVYVISLSDFQSNGKYKLIFQELNNLIQIYKSPSVKPDWMDEKELVCSRIKLTQWIGKPNKRFIQKQIKEDEYALVPDSPVKNIQGIVLETSNNWVNQNTAHRLVEYVTYEDIHNEANTEFNGTLYHVVEKSDLHIMALLFLRTKFIPIIEKFDILKKDLNNNTATCEKCGKTAEGFDEIISFIGVNFENKSPEINKLCKICNND